MVYTSRQIKRNRERERETERTRQREREREGEREPTTQTTDRDGAVHQLFNFINEINMHLINNGKIINVVTVLIHFAKTITFNNLTRVLFVHYKY